MAENSKNKDGLSEKDKKFREFVLNGNMWRVTFRVCIPLAAYQGLLQIFKIIDTLIAAHIGTEAVSSVAYISQISLFISALGNGLAIGAGMKISEAYGAGDYELVRKRVSSVYALCAAISVPVLLILPFSTQFLRLNGTPETLIETGRQYFFVEILAIVTAFFNTAYIAVERARGNTGLILRINVVYLAAKTLLTAGFVYGLDGGVVSISLATLISNLTLLAMGMKNILAKDSIFGFSFSAVSFGKKVILPVIKTSYPAAAEKAAFAYGKLIVNKMSAEYGDSTVGALGVSNNIGGIASNLQNGFQEGGASIISQNIGAGKIGRALEAYRKILVVNVIIGAVFMTLTLLFLDFISGLFAGSDGEFRLLIVSVYRYEALGAVTLGINAAVMALLYGFGYTKLTLLLNVMRVFVFRIPVLWYFQNYTDMGSKSVGAVMMVSNISIGVCGLIAAFFVIRRIKRRTNIC